MERRFEIRKRELLAECKVDPGEFEGPLERLEEYAQPFLSWLTRREQREYARTYLAGLVSNVDAKTLVSFYRGLEPLFQEAYEDLGHPNQSFNARLNEVIEHLLQTPTPRGEIALVQPSVLYKYADERLENLSAGQKLMIRMGVNNATVIKGKLREIQAELL